MNIRIIFLLALSIAISACGNSENSATSSGASSTTSIEPVVLEQKGEVGKVVNAKYEIRNANGEFARATLHWGDGTSDSVFGVGKVGHSYNKSGTYKVALQSSENTKILIRKVEISRCVSKLLVPSSEQTVSRTGEGDRSNAFYAFKVAKNGCIELVPNTSESLLDLVFDLPGISVTSNSNNAGTSITLVVNAYDEIRSVAMSQIVCAWWVNSNQGGCIDVSTGIPSSFRIVIGEYICSGRIKLTGKGNPNFSIKSSHIPIDCT